jgi:type II secretory pathway pseudopilin PulG
VAAFSLIELLFVLGVAATLTAGAAPALSAGLHEMRAAGAARYVSARLQQARLRAITRSRDVALEVRHDSTGYLITTFEDGNRNGVLTRDIGDGIDVPVGRTERIVDQFAGVDFGALPGLPGADGSVAPGADPIRLGATDRVTFTATGTATPGSLYVRGRGSAQYVVRILGETGRTRVLRFNAATGTWHPQ